MAMVFAKQAEELLLNCDNDAETAWLKVLEVTELDQEAEAEEDSAWLALEVVDSGREYVELVDLYVNEELLALGWTEEVDFRWQVLEVIELVGTVTLESVLALVTVGLEAGENVGEDVIEVRCWVELVENVE
jgi:hypothetical protein